MNLTKLRYEIENIYSLPTIPPTLRKLIILIEDPNISVDELGEFILKDTSLTARVIRAANSPIYGFTAKITKVSQAIMMLGLNAIKGLLLGVTVFEYLPETIVGLWKHSRGCATSARIISEMTNNNNITEDVSVASLIHDIGKVALTLKYSNEYAKVISLSEQKQTYLTDEEMGIFGVTHADVGSWLIYRWNFPLSLVEAIKYHHQTANTKDLSKETCIVSLANEITKLVSYGYSGERFLHQIGETVFDSLMIDEDLMRQIFKEVVNTLKDDDL
ncbi:MAG: HDOD domain-containing protein [Thermodesulfovibrionales bacterium]|nr:HDOD domain-containing protein [Thermodesulfovibrionales bacterium]